MLQNASFAARNEEKADLKRALGAICRRIVSPKFWIMFVHLDKSCHVFDLSLLFFISFNPKISVEGFVGIHGSDGRNQVPPKVQKGQRLPTTLQRQFESIAGMLKKDAAKASGAARKPGRLGIDLRW